MICFSQSDIISIHLNLTNETNSLLGKEKSKLIKKSAILITSRGEILDEDAIPMHEGWFN